MTNKLLKTLNFGGEDTYELAPKWKNIENRPFGEFETGGDTLTWDGNTDGLESWENYYRINDFTPTLAELQSGGEITVQDSSKLTFSSTEVVDLIGDGSGKLYGITDGEIMLIIVAYEDNIEVEPGVYLPKEGVYFAYYNDGSVISYTKSLTINGYTGFPCTKKLDNKYLDLPFGIDYDSATVLADNQTITFNEESGGFELDFLLKEGKAYDVIFNGTERKGYVTTVTDFDFSGGSGTMICPLLYIGNGSPLGISEDTGDEFFIMTVDQTPVGGSTMSVLLFMDDTLKEIALSVTEYNIVKLPKAYYESPKRTEFYFNITGTDEKRENGYMYIDSSCTTPVPAETFESALKNGFIVFALVDDGGVSPFKFVYSDLVQVANEYYVFITTNYFAALNILLCTAGADPNE